MLSGSEINVCVCIFIFLFFYSMGTPVSQHLTLWSNIESKKKKNGQKCRSSKKNKAPVAVMTQGSGNILPALKFSEQRGSKAFDI